MKIKRGIAARGAYGEAAEEGKSRVEDGRRGLEREAMQTRAFAAEKKKMRAYMSMHCEETEAGGERGKQRMRHDDDVTERRNNNPPSRDWRAVPNSTYGRQRVCVVSITG